MKVQVYIDQSKLDLFDDEKIEITQKLNDIEKLSSVFTDFTNSFTVPATPKNNGIFKHYYDVDIDGGFNVNTRIAGLIELDTLPFKFGEWQLEGVVVKNGLPDNYKITFYSKSVQLTKLFGEETIDQLDYEIVNNQRVKTWDSLSQFDFPYEQSNLLKTLNDPTYKNGDIITPLISYTNRDWNYGTNDTFDISSSTYSITTMELLQALRVIRIIEGIETKYGISFSRDFFGTTMFNKLFLLLNSKGSKSLSTFVDFVNPATYNQAFPLYITCNVNTTDNIITFIDNAYAYTGLKTFNLNISFVSFREPNGSVANFPSGTKFTIRVIDNDTGLDFFSKLVEYNGSTIQLNIPIQQQPTPKTYNFKVSIEAGINFTYGGFTCKLVFSSGLYIEEAGSYNNSGNFLNNMTTSNKIPSMKVIDFLQGIMKMFKLVIRATSPTDFYVNTLDGYYSQGTILDITKYTDIESINIDRPSIYKNISFTYKATENILGKRFRLAKDPVNRKIGYGDLMSEYLNITENNNLSVQLPFENMLFERLVVQSPNVNVGDLTNINIGQSCKLNEDQTISPNNSGPILFFNNGIIDTSTYPIKYQFGLTSPVQTLNSIYNIGNTDNQVYNNITTSINWGSEIDPWHYREVAQSLYLNYWSNWITTIYSIKQRKFKFEGYLPPRYIQELSLNDALIIGQNRYNISDYTIDLVTGKTTFNLFNDIKRQQQL
jgi:hypothetical protein